MNQPRVKPRPPRPSWHHAVQAAADPTRARQGFEQLAAVSAALASLTPEHARILAALFSGSPALTVWLLKHPEWAFTVLAPENLAHPRQEQGLRREVLALLEPEPRGAGRRGSAPATPGQSGMASAATGGFSAAVLTQIRLFKQREMLRIAARDLARLGDAMQMTREISSVADVCLDAVLRLCRQPLAARLGQPWHRDADGDWQPTPFAVLGLGKHGGQELNYSSDVDVMFVYAEEGHVFKEPPRNSTPTERALTSHAFFKRLAEVFVVEVTRATAEGTLFRIDVRLRPEGDAGPLVRSLPSCENFYAQWGQTWERMMLIKARGVAGDAALAAEFNEVMQPFRYPRSLNRGALGEIAAMKARTEAEVVRSGELDRNVKLGRGGIREIEFIAQTTQLLHAGRLPFLQGAQTLPTLQKMAQYKLLEEDQASALADAYCFLRDVEHRLQMEQNRQTHTIPADPAARARLAALMGFRKPAGFDDALRRHTEVVRATYEKFVPVDTPAPEGALPRQFKGEEARWKKLLAAHSFQDVARSMRLLDEFAHGPGFVHTSQRTTVLAFQLLPRFLSLCRPESQAGPGTPSSPTKGRKVAPDPGAASHPRPTLSDPDRVLARLDSFITAYGTRAMLFETWAGNPQVFELLLLLFDRSEFLAEIAIRTPDLLDDLVLSGRLGRRKNAGEILRDLQHGRRDPDQRLWLRRYHQAEFLRIGLRDILGLADAEQHTDELSALADACLQYALEIVLRKHKLKTPPLVIIGLGKLGGAELTYGSDLDILFVANDKARKSLPKLQKLAAEVMDLLSAPTELGTAFATDARLRPDGEKGLLVNTLAAHEDYYRQRAQLWELQALTRVRPVAGDLRLGARFQERAARLTDFRSPQPPPAAYGPDWKAVIARMRQRIEKERTPAGQDALAFKTGAGGIIDAEFIAQVFCLQEGWQEANTLRALERLRAAGLLAPEDAASLLENCRRLRRVESILRRWSFEGETVLPAEPAPYYRVSVRCGFETPEQFRDAVASWRRAVRIVYQKVFPEVGLSALSAE